MARFTWVPDYQASIEEAPTIDKAKMGDGYTQRAQRGINSLLKVWTLRFFRDNAQVMDIRAFLRLQGGVTSFDWLDPDGEDRRYICEKWSRSFDGFGGQTLSATFEEVPE